MRHRVDKKKLSRDVDHRKALLRNLSTALITYESIRTTESKAKFVKPYVEKLVTKAKSGYSFNLGKYLKTKLYSEDTIKKLINDIAPRYLNRPGGYTRIVKIGNRDGDKAMMARIEFVKEVATTKKTKAKKTGESEKKIEKAKPKTTKKVKKPDNENK